MVELLQDVLDFAREGFAEVNAVQGLIIAFIAALMLSKWTRLLIIAAGSVLAHIALDVMSPVFAEVGAFRLPDLLQQSYWHYVTTLFVGYVVVIGILFTVKRVVVKR